MYCLLRRHDVCDQGPRDDNDAVAPRVQQPNDSDNNTSSATISTTTNNNHNHNNINMNAYILYIVTVT